jgi:hypothetical protein
VSALSPHRASERTGLLGKLLAGVRPEFRVEVYLAHPDDPVMGRLCRVSDCDRSWTEGGLCSSHGRRWRARGRPAMAVFLADPGPTLNGRRDLTPCSVSGCRYGSSGSGLCMRHRSAWTRDGRPDPVGWAARAGLLGPPDPTQCLLPFCTLWTQNARNRYCKAHTTRWRQLGRPDSADYLTHCLQRGKARIDFRGLAPQLKLELALSCAGGPRTQGADCLWGDGGADRVVLAAGFTFDRAHRLGARRGRVGGVENGCRSTVGGWTNRTGPRADRRSRARHVADHLLADEPPVECAVCCGGCARRRLPAPSGVTRTERGCPPSPVEVRCRPGGRWPTGIRPASFRTLSGR